MTDLDDPLRNFPPMTGNVTAPPGRGNAVRRAVARTLPPPVRFKHA